MGPGSLVSVGATAGPDSLCTGVWVSSYTGSLGFVRFYYFLKRLPSCLIFRGSSIFCKLAVKMCPLVGKPVSWRNPNRRLLDLGIFAGDFVSQFVYEIRLSPL